MNLSLFRVRFLSTLLFSLWFLFIGCSDTLGLLLSLLLIGSVPFIDVHWVRNACDSLTQLSHEFHCVRKSVEPGYRKLNV